MWCFLNLNDGKFVKCKGSAPTRRRRNIHKHLPPWILLAFLTTAFMIANVWLIERSRDPDVNKMTKHAGLLIGLFVGLFFVACIVAAVLWTRYQKRASKCRNPVDTEQAQSGGISQRRVCQAFHLNNEILILRDLSNPDEVFCINLSDSSAPVVKGKSMISVEEYFQDLILPTAPEAREITLGF